jgi:hypothetical protein
MTRSGRSAQDVDADPVKLFPSRPDAVGSTRTVSGGRRRPHRIDLALAAGRATRLPGMRMMRPAEGPRS